ncbi:MGH1-like glycoside hydrolase domain-containing protein [Methylobacterium sp. J-076]|uniref:MGH1-like glycoside hydrolase domain-containing protein n=1 Tax=Methylobacterium sp. J-076 TaxID=2836655 RepID=UPI001FBAAF6E|nr:glucosidase [Methylobacterium sp. J-076]MCJ2011424.1 glucosidase [Methylobacterium sp. J-076]
MSEPTDWAERRRIAEQARGERAWSLWGPYLSERQWGTVREDYSQDGDAWRALPHDQARSRAYRWGEDGLAGICDERGQLCLALAVWNGRDHILKERLFGLTNGEGNHGEDVKEVYHYLDALPSHAYLKFLYRYPQAAFPYEELTRVGLQRRRDEPEYEIEDTGVFAENRYFDLTVEYAKEDVDDIHLVVTALNRGPEAADLHLVPQLWFRNTWSWTADAPRPRIVPCADGGVACSHEALGDYRLSFEGEPALLFCENDTNLRRHGGSPESAGPFKDGLHAAIVEGDASAVRRDGGTKLGLHYALRLEPGGTARIRLRLSGGSRFRPVQGEDATLRRRRGEADAFYDGLQEGIADADARVIFRQAAAGLIWSKQLYRYDVRLWLRGDPLQPVPPHGRETGRNAQWRHFAAADVLSMPDTWEYPWFAAWDLAFHCLPLAILDPDFAKRQLLLLTREWYMHPNGQLPAYEWEFGDANPPVHAWATYRVFEIDRDRRGGRGDLAFLEGVFHKLLINFTWWVNRKDADGRNVFQGGFLGLDNVGVFDRSRPPPGFGRIHQADGTAWMAMYALNMMRIALELALDNHVYESTASKFFEHFLLIAEAMTDMGGEGFGLWDGEDEFYYDKVDIPGDGMVPLRVRSLVGLVPLFAVEVIEPSVLHRLPDFARRLNWLMENRPHLACLVSRWNEGGVRDRKLLSLLRGHRMKALLRRMLDEAEFLSAHGVRSMSKAHRDHPFVLNQFGASFTVRYDPAESTSNMFGGNSNWRGPVWMPVNYLIIESLRRFHTYYGDDFLVEYPTGSGVSLTLNAIADGLEDRLIGLFAKGPDGARPIFGARPPMPPTPGGEEALLFHEYFDGDTGAGLGASHQTGWTALILNLLHHRAHRPPGS